MRIPTEELLTAIYGRLTVGANKINYQVYDDVPENAKPPYVEIGDVSLVPWNEKNSSGVEIEVTFFFWSIQASNKEIDDMKNAVLDSITVSDGDTAVNRNILTLTNHTVINQFLVNAFTRKDIDMRTRQGVMVFMFQIAE